MTFSQNNSLPLPASIAGAVRCEEVKLACGGMLAILTLNKPATLNALDLPMVTALLQIVLRWKKDESVRALFIDSVVEKAFCAGGDVRAMRESALKRSSEDAPCEEAEAFFSAEYRLDYALHTFGKPVIVWGHGIVMGGGLGIFAAGSHRVVTESTRIAMPEITIALFPDVGASHFLQKMPGSSGHFCALTAARLAASDAIYTELATHCLAQDKKSQVLNSLLTAPFTGNDADDRKMITALLNAYVDKQSDIQSSSQLQKYQALIDQCCDGGDIACVVDNILAVSSSDKWWQDCQQSLQQGSPITLRVIEKQWQLAANVSLAEVFQLDYLLATNIVRHPEFSEGVRALLVDKDRQPKWKYTSVREVPDSVVEALFSPPWPQNPLADLSEH